jgi:cytochrome c peroxidase
MTVAKVELGRRLFYDTRLSGNGTFSCASCHQQARAFSDGRHSALGSTGQRHVRNTMALVNVAYNASFGWADPTRRSLEAQMAVPMFNEHPIELGLAGREQEIVARFAADPADADHFREAFPDSDPPVSLATIVKAIASFERTMVSGDSPVDRYLYRDDRTALPLAARRGLKLFFSDRLRCALCHGTFNLSGPVAFDNAGVVDPVFHNTGLYNVDGAGGYPASDRGLFDVTGTAEDMGRFRAPTLRNIAVTAPYMHDGSVPTLAAAVAHYASGGRPSPFKSDRVAGFRLNASEADDLVAFLESLTDRTFLTNPALANPGPR